MQTEIDLRETRRTLNGVGIHPRHAWILGLIAEPDGTLWEAGPTPEWGDCTCPEDCQRDHEHE